VVLLAGETSAGKTVLTYNVAYHLAQGKVFAGLSPEGCVRVLYIDLESPEDVHRTLVKEIGRSPSLAFVRSMPQTLNTGPGREDLKQAIREWEPKVVIIDPLPVAWPSADENDNAEADRQMTALKQIAVETETVIVVLWNMGEGQVKAKLRPRGATAWVDRADLVINYTEHGENTRRLAIAKSRYGTLGQSIAVRFAGHFGFEPTVLLSTTIPSHLQEIKARIKELASQGLRTRKEIVEAVKKDGVGKENLIDKALGELVNLGELIRTERGTYVIPSAEGVDDGDRTGHGV
jgi:RecA-family ATPase